MLDSYSLDNTMRRFGAVQIDEDRYAFKAGRWYSATEAALIDFGKWLDSKRTPANAHLPDAIFVSQFNELPEVDNAIVKMPSWWTPQTPSAQRAKVPYTFGDRYGEYFYYPHHDAILHGCAPSTVHTVVVDVRTGVERLATPQEIREIQDEVQAKAIELDRVIVNLTQHPATPDQIAAGVVEFDETAKEELIQTLTFDGPPTSQDIVRKARFIARLVRDVCGKHIHRAMIGGAPYFMAELEKALLDVGISPCYAFSKRESIEEIAPDGSVKKTAVFKHAGFVDPPSVFAVSRPNIDGTGTPPPPSTMSM